MATKGKEETTINILTEDDTLLPLVFYISSGGHGGHLKSVVPYATHSQFDILCKENKALKQLHSVNSLRRYILAESVIVSKIPYALMYLKEKLTNVFEEIQTIDFQHQGCLFTEEEIVNDIPLTIKTIYKRLNNVVIMLVEELRGTLLPQGIDYNKFFGVDITSEPDIAKLNIQYITAKHYYKVPYVFIQDGLHFKEEEEEGVISFYTTPVHFKTFLEKHMQVQGFKEVIPLIEPQVFEKVTELEKEVTDVFAEEVECVVYVDCDNIGYFNFLKLISTIKKDTEGKIKVKLFIDPRTRGSWARLDSTRVDMEYIEVPRMLGNKSVVDILLVAHFCRDTQEGVKKYILSSDSDFFVLNTLGDKFTVVYNKESVSVDYITYMRENNIENYELQTLIPSEEMIEHYIKSVLTQEILTVMAKIPLVQWGTSLQENIQAYVSVEHALGITEKEVTEANLVKTLKALYSAILNGVKIESTPTGVYLQYEKYRHVCTP